MRNGSFRWWLGWNQEEWGEKSSSCRFQPLDGVKVAGYCWKLHAQQASLFLPFQKMWSKHHLPVFFDGPALLKWSVRSLVELKRWRAVVRENHTSLMKTIDNQKSWWQLRCIPYCYRYELFSLTHDFSGWPLSVEAQLKSPLKSRCAIVRPFLVSLCLMIARMPLGVFTIRVLGHIAILVPSRKIIWTSWS